MSKIEEYIEKYTEDYAYFSKLLSHRKNYKLINQVIAGEAWLDCKFRYVKWIQSKYNIPQKNVMDRELTLLFKNYYKYSNYEKSILQKMIK